VSFADLAAFCIHDVKNRLAILAARAEAKGDHDTVRDALIAAGDLSRLLTCYKADAGMLKADIDAHCPIDVLNELAAEYRASARQEICVDSDNSPTLGYYDENLIRMVLAGALQNALRHARTRITLSVREVDPWIEFRVRDDGEGYPAEVLSNSTVQGSITREGIGIGLYLSKQVAALHEARGLVGCVLLRNEGGAEFVLRIPA
jgi:two-component system sensor histidine kinase SenX3